MKINVLYINALKVKLYFAFMFFVLEAIDKYEIIKQLFAGYVNRIRAAYDQLNLVYLKYDHKFYTQAVQDKDKERNTAFRELNDAVRAITLFPPSEEKKQAAEIVLKIISLYGASRIVFQGMNEKTTSIINLVEDLEQKYPQEVQTLGVENLVAALKLAQENFNEVYMSRAEYDSEIGKRAMAEARRNMSKAYRDFVTIVNLEAEYDPEGKLSNFIKLLNVEIGKYRTYTGQGQASAGGSGNEPEEDEPTDEPEENEPEEDEPTDKPEGNEPTTPPAGNEPTTPPSTGGGSTLQPDDDDEIPEGDDPW